MATPLDNDQQLRNFVETHHLRNQHSFIHFNAFISITTAQNKIINMPAEIMINFDDYGHAWLQKTETELDPRVYPTDYDAKYQAMEHIDGEFLLITDTHRKNSVIGKYTVRIHPLKRTRD